MLHLAKAHRSFSPQKYNWYVTRYV